LSKILELLSYNNKKKTTDKNGDFSNRIIIPEGFDAKTKEKLANTYIFNPADNGGNTLKKNTPKKPVSLSQYNTITGKKRISPIFPWLISFLAILLLLVNMAYRGKVNITIEFLKEGASSSEAVNQAEAPARAIIPAMDGGEAAPVSAYLVADGEFNNYLVKKGGFYGAAISRSRIIRDELYLFNDGSAGWASMGLDLAKPMDLSESCLDFFVKGTRGDESLELILRDVDNKSYIPQAYDVVLDKNMGMDWQFVSIPLKGLEGPYNAEKINHIGLEFGTQTTSNEPGTSIYIKKMKLVKVGAIP